MIKFGRFLKGWIARAFPELLPPESLQRCDDLNFTIEGALRCVRELVELSSPSGTTDLTYSIEEFAQVSSGASTLTYKITGNKLYRSTNAASYIALQDVVDTVQDPTSYTEVDIGADRIVPHSTGVRVTSLACDEDVYCYKDFGLEYFDSDFRIDFDVYCTSDSTVSDGPGIVSLDNLIGAHANTSGGVMIYWEAGKCYIRRLHGTTPSDSSGVTTPTGTTNYMSFIRDEAAGAYTLTRYSNSSRTSVLYSATLGSLGTDFRYAYIVRGSNSGIVGETWSGRVNNIDIIEQAKSRLRYAHMTPMAATRSYVYIATPGGLIRDSGQAKYQSGTTWIEVGCQSASASGVTQRASTSGSGNLSPGSQSTYKYKFTYYDSETGAESLTSGVSTLTGVSAAQVAFSWSPDGGGHADKVKVYRTIADGGTFYLQGTYDKTATKITDNTGDSSLGDPIGAVGRPDPTATLVETWKQRLWIAGISNLSEGADTGLDAANRIYFSRANNPETVPEDYYLAIADSEAEVKALAVMSDSLYVLTRKKIFEVLGSTPDSFDLGETLATVGTVAPASVAVGDEGIYYVSYSGVYLFKVNSRKVSENIDWVFSDGGDIWNSAFSRQQIESAKGTYWNGYYYLAIGGYVLVYDPQAKRWHRRTRAASFLWTDRINDYLWSGVSINGHYGVARLSADGTAGAQGLYSPDFMTAPTPIIQLARDERLKRPRLGLVTSYKVHALGYWQFDFYVDDVLAHSASGVTFTLSMRHNEYRFPTGLKGERIYVRGRASSNARPNSCRFYSMEIW